MDIGQATADTPEIHDSTPNPTNASTDSDAPPAHFASLLATITPSSLISLAVRIRNDTQESGEGSKGCSVIQPPKFGSFNLLYTVEFADGVKRVVRIPSPREINKSRSLRSEAYTMIFLRRHTSIPIPEIYAFDETATNEISAPFILMNFVTGQSVDELWFDDTGPTPLNLRRIRILESLALAMSELSQFQFDKIGSLQFNQDDDLSLSSSIGGFTVPDEQADLEDMENGIDRGGNFRKMGPFDVSSL
jgi:hypothetical protein